MAEITAAASTGKLDIEAENRLVYSARTHVGLIREHNEDSLVALPPLFAVCDGMGGHEAGEVASKIAIETLVREAPETADGEALCRAVVAANHAVIEGAEKGDGRPGMGTTCTSVIIDGLSLVISHVGDSRAYLLRDSKLTQLTQDHSLVADLVRTGRITEEEARIHPQRSVITRALGSDTAMVPDLYEVVLEPTDRLLINSDGLSGMVPDEDIEKILDSCVTPEECADTLIDAALAGGGHDNVTVIVVDIPGIREEHSPDKDTREIEPVVEQIATAVSAASPDPSPEIAAAEAALADAYDAQVAAAHPGAHAASQLNEAELREKADEIARAVTGGFDDEPAKKGHRGVIAFIVALVCVVALAIGGVYAYAKHVAYVIEEDGVIAVYQGFPDDIAGVQLHWYVKGTDIQVSELPEPTQERLKSGVKVSSLEEADKLLTDYRQQISEAQVANSDFTAPNQPHVSEAATGNLTEETAAAAEAAAAEAPQATEEAGE